MGTIKLETDSPNQRDSAELSPNTGVTIHLSKTKFRRLKGSLLAADGRDFERAALPFVRILVRDTVPAPALGTVDRIGADLIAWGERGGIRLVVQCKGFKVSEEELGPDQIRQCLASIESFRSSGEYADEYLLIHNRFGRDVAFRERITHALTELEAEGRVGEAKLWACDTLLRQSADALKRQILNHIRNASRSQREDGTGLERTHVPLRKSELVVDRNQLKTVRAGDPTVADPSVLILSVGAGVDARAVLIGEAGFGKTTAALRAAVSAARHVFVVRAAGLTAPPLNKSTLHEQFIFVDEFLTDFPPEDLETLRQLATMAVDSIFSTPGVPAVLIIDGMDESITLSRPGGMQWLFNVLNLYQIPVVLVARTEFWMVRRIDFATSFGLIAPKKGTKQRDLHVQLVELLPWTEAEIAGLAGNYRDHLTDVAQRARVEAFIALVRNGEYSRVYGDIPKRPLFLMFILDTVSRLGVHPVRRAQLLFEWAREKIVRDYLEPITHVVGAQRRVGIVRSEDETVESTIYLAFLAMKRAARLMTQLEGTTLEMLPACGVSDILDAEPRLRAIDDPLGLFLNSLLVPMDSRGLEGMARFSHQVYQEFFLAHFIKDRPGEFVGVTLPLEVRGWMAELQDANGELE